MPDKTITEVLEDLTSCIESGSFYCTNLDGNHFTVIEKLLEDAGFKPAESLSTCKVALREGYWSKGGIRAQLVVSNLFGIFTDVRLTSI